MYEDLKHKTIAVAMSGGVDSSVVASLLKDKGFKVIGFTMVNFNDSIDNNNNYQDIKTIKSVIDAKKVCEKLEIPHYAIDLRKDFHDNVIRYFIDEYSKGRTPNPCTYCNPLIKWGLFVSKIEEVLLNKHMVNDYLLATGHYAKIKKLDSGLSAIFKAEDDKRDQTYMLWGLSQYQISKTIFPLADYHKNNNSDTKSSVRDIAKTINNDLAEKKDSQDICFISGKYTDFLSLYIDFKPGNLLYEYQDNNEIKHKIIGQHKGLPLYTLGQRKGLVSWHQPLYVKKLDYIYNSVIVTDNQAGLLSDSFIVSNVNWQQNSLPDFNEDVKVQIRYNSTLKEIASVEFINNKLKITLKSPARSITPGQSAVFYLNDQLLGGGIIN